MSSGSYKQADVLCPFYKYDDGKRRITCEGVMGDSSLALIFKTRADFENTLCDLCCERYDSCEVYKMLMQKYID